MGRLACRTCVLASTAVRYLCCAAGLTFLLHSTVEQARQIAMKLGVGNEVFSFNLSDPFFDQELTVKMSQGHIPRMVALDVNLRTL